MKYLCAVVIAVAMLAPAESYSQANFTLVPTKVAAKGNWDPPGPGPCSRKRHPALCCAKRCARPENAQGSQGAFCYSGCLRSISDAPRR
jgi:hypothetical protein